VLSIFHESQDWLRDTIPDYRQVYLKVDYSKLKERDNKQLYKKAEKGEIADVVGVQIPFPEPKKSDFILDNNENDISPTKLAQDILNGLKIEVPSLHYQYTDKDLLTNPIKYQYLPFEGKEFLAAYRTNRLNALAKLHVRLKEYERGTVLEKQNDQPNDYRNLTAYLLRPLNKSLPGSTKKWHQMVEKEILPVNYRNHFLGNHPINDSLITREYLVNELDAIINSTWEYSTRQQPLFTLLKRFEVSKKIFTHYSMPEIKKIRHEFSDLLNFTLFHRLLIEVHAFASYSARTVLGNGILKMGDLLISIIYRLSTPAQFSLTCASLHQELKLMEETHGI
jgi:adenylylsulfate kinase